MSIDEKKTQAVTIFRRPPQYLVQEWDLEKIDSLIAALNYAVSEILSRRAIKEQYPWNESPAQEDFDAQIQEVLIETELEAKKPRP